jgi:hypothetical protein
MVTGFDLDNQMIQKYLVKAINRLAAAIEKFNEVKQNKDD